ncbi:TetR/AcrR family transcriptional regulator [Streptacidiphilus sp. ASG 303]|uniref:TetR family transcriptional regulator n=1 Tax=Streptacidiphilus sp. ASG 303 TaxID=2896847 RepID=UPI001E65C08B|nr:TetR family transcriptional regulator [Streptacidiphilus sp. ASG 303]MCD0483519.1 TetR/AcrR family transcriptional regulator [Streptacidiphilus sp. ASG 303]
MPAADPGASIAAEAGVDRRTVHRRFAGREDLLAAIHESRVFAVEEADGPGPAGRGARRRRPAPLRRGRHRREPDLARRPCPLARRRHHPPTP